MDANEQYFRAQNPFVDLSLSLVPQLANNINSYDQPSCNLVQQLCQAGMVACDMLNTGQPVSVVLLLNDLWTMFWSLGIAFDQVDSTATGSSSVNITAAARSVLISFSGWDNALQPSPFASLTASFYALLQGVTP